MTCASCGSKKSEALSARSVMVNHSGSADTDTSDESSESFMKQLTDDLDAMRAEQDPYTAIRIFLERPLPKPVVCACIGKASGDPECPCGMRYIVKVNSVFYHIQREIQFGKLMLSAEKVAV